MLNKKIPNRRFKFGETQAIPLAKGGYALLTVPVRKTKILPASSGLCDGIENEFTINIDGPHIWLDCHTVSRIDIASEVLKALGITSVDDILDIRCQRYIPSHLGSFLRAFVIGPTEIVTIAVRGTYYKIFNSVQETNNIQILRFTPDDIYYSVRDELIRLKYDDDLSVFSIEKTVIAQGLSCIPIIAEITTDYGDESIFALTVDGKVYGIMDQDQRLLVFPVRKKVTKPIFHYIFVKIIYQKYRSKLI